MKYALILLILLLNGCSLVKTSPQEIKIEKDNTEEPLSCEIKAKPKSLELLEQQYRCTSKGGV